MFDMYSVNRVELYAEGATDALSAISPGRGLSSAIQSVRFDAGLNRRSLRDALQMHDRPEIVAP